MKMTLFYRIKWKKIKPQCFHTALHMVYTSKRKLIRNINVPNQLLLIMLFRQAPFSITCHLNRQPRWACFCLVREEDCAQHSIHSPHPKGCKGLEATLCFELMLLKCFRARGAMNIGGGERREEWIPHKWVFQENENQMIHLNTVHYSSVGRQTINLLSSIIGSKDSLNQLIWYFVLVHQVLLVAHCVLPQKLFFSHFTIKQYWVSTFSLFGLKTGLNEVVI